MRDVMGTLVAIVVLLLAGAVAGGSLVYQRCENDKAKAAAVADEKLKKYKEIADEINREQEERLRHAWSEGGRVAVARFMRDHGLLPDGPPVRGPSGGDANGSIGADAAACKQGACGCGAGIEEFAQRCAADAITVMMWIEWAKKEGLEVRGPSVGGM